MTLLALTLSKNTLNVTPSVIDLAGDRLSLNNPISLGLADLTLKIPGETNSANQRISSAAFSAGNDNALRIDGSLSLKNFKIGIEIPESASLRRGSASTRHEYAPIEITIFNNTNNKSISKHIFLNDEKKVVSDGSHCAISRGTAQRFVCALAQEFADMISHLQPHAAIALGRLRPDIGDSAPLVAEKYLNSEKQGTISRTQKYIGYRKGSPAVMLLDFDQKAMTPANKKRLEELGGFEGAIAHIIDGYSKVARVIRRSTSSGLYNDETGETYGDSGGLHLYLFVADGDDTERALKVLQQRSWLLGLGWIYVSAAGSLLVRSIVDVSVETPERLVFEGSPTLDQPLAQRERPADATEGALLDTRKALQNLSSVEKQEYERLVAEAKLAAKPDAEKVVKKAIEKAVKEAVANGIPEARARAAAEKTYSNNANRVLLPTQIFLFDNPEIGKVTGADILTNPKRFDGETLADPLEVYDAAGSIMRNRAICLIGKQHGDVLIYSQLHGGLRYILRHDLESLREIILTTPKESLVAVFIRALVAGGADSPVSQSDESILVSEVAKKSGAGKRAINTEIAEARDRRNSSRKSAELTPKRLLNRTTKQGPGTVVLGSGSWTVASQNAS